MELMIVRVDTGVRVRITDRQKDKEHRKICSICFDTI